jgi:CO/xanthine dehydrogenase FAD-binding subunit
MATIERYAVPQSLDEAVQILAEEKATMFAGGTDLILQAQLGGESFQTVLVNIGRIPELKGISQSNGTIRIGALTTISDLLGSPLLRDRALVLVETADCFASGQVRNTATLGGNICNASPAADMVIPLLLLDATVELASAPNGKSTSRSLPLGDFFMGPGKARIRPNEILTHVQFPAPGRDFVARFKKFGTRPALDIAVVSVGIAATKDNGVLRNVRVAFGAVAPTPLRGTKTEAAIEGAALNEEERAAIAGIAVDEIDPISDIRGSAWYRRQLVKTITERLLHDVA